MAKKLTVHLRQGAYYTWCGRKASTIQTTNDRNKVTCKTCKIARGKHTLINIRG